MVNRAILIGRLGRDPELRYTQTGSAVCNMSVATSEKYKGEEKTEWHRVVAFGKLAEVCGQYLAKGKQAYIEGKVQTRNWEDRDGNKRYTTEIVANTVQFLGGGRDEERKQDSGYEDHYEEVTF